MLLKLSANQSLGIKDSVGGIAGHLLGSKGKLSVLPMEIAHAHAAKFPGLTSKYAWFLAASPSSRSLSVHAT